MKAKDRVKIKVIVSMRRLMDRHEYKVYNDGTMGLLVEYCEREGEWK